MCIKCGVNLDKYGVFGLHGYMVDKFFEIAEEMGTWDGQEQVYLPPDDDVEHYD